MTGKEILATLRDNNVSIQRLADFVDNDNEENVLTEDYEEALAQNEIVSKLKSECATLLSTYRAEARNPNREGSAEVAWLDYSTKNQELVEFVRELQITTLGLGRFTLVDHYGGEGQGDNYFHVIHFEEHGVYIKVSGYYASYEGVTWDDMYEVKPVTKTIIEYEHV